MRKLFLWSVVLYLRFWARIALRLHKPKVIGIAGSVGKSSTRNILYSALQDHVRVKNIFGNSETGIPLGILGITPQSYDIFSWLFMLLRAPLGIFSIRSYKFLIIEMGIDEPYPPRNMEYLLSVVKPDIAISLNVSATHTQQFEALLQEEQYKDVAMEKRHEFLLQKIAEDDVGIITRSGCDVGIYNQDDTYITQKIDDFRKTSPTKLLSFGEQGDIQYGEYRLGLDTTVFSFRLDAEYFSVSVAGYTLPREYREVIAASLLAAREVGVDVHKAAESIEKNFSIPKGRSSIFEGVNNSVIIDSSYNASRVATIAFLEMVKKLKQQSKRPVVFLFGDMRELGGEAANEHHEVNKYIKGVADYLYCVGPLTAKYVIPEFENDKKMREVRHFESAVEAGEYMQKNVPKNSLILVKGSQNTIFLEEAVKEILKNKDDSKKLCRQEAYWMEIKNG